MNIREEIKRFIARIQESDDRTKKFWMVVFVSISMAIMLGLWSLQLGNLIVSLGDIEEEAASERVSFLQTFGAGVKEATRWFGGGLEKLGEGRSVTIENKTPNFAATGADEIKPTPLR